MTRLLKPERARFIERAVHEHAKVDGRTHHFRTALVHDDQKPFEVWLDRHNRYSTLEAEARLRPGEGSPGGSRAVKQWIRQHMWPRVPLKPLAFFLYVYIVRLGFLDGLAGLRIAIMYGVQELAVQVKIEERRHRV